MNIFDQYGIKEVADVTLYSIHKRKDSGEVYYMPALYLDTLKISSVEKTAEDVWAQGGLGNSNLICWDYGKNINVTLEDALCTPASLSLCWSGILSADWKDAKVDINTDVNVNTNPLKRVSRIEKAFYPRQNMDKEPISSLLPKVKSDVVDSTFDLLKISSVVDGTDIRGFGTCHDRTYRWKMAIESAVKSIAVVPDRFFDVKGQRYPLDWDRKISVNSLPTYENFKDAVIYKIGKPSTIVPPTAKIIFDEGSTLGEKGETTFIGHDSRESLRLCDALKLHDAVQELYANGMFTFKPADTLYYCFPYESMSKVYYGTYDEDKKTYNYNVAIKYFKVTDETLISKLAQYKIPLDTSTLTDSLVTYYQNHATTDLVSDILGSDDTVKNIKEVEEAYNICDCDYLAIIVDNNNEYTALVGKSLGGETEDEYAQAKVTWGKPIVPIDTWQFKNIDMWLRFDSINEMIYFLITKYENDIISITPATINSSSNDYAVDKAYTKVDDNDDEERALVEGKLWSYINPMTMKPFEDDYWFSQGEPFYIESLTIAPRHKKLKGNRIFVKAGQFPGMYMFVGETYIRSRDTGEDERMQIRIPLCKVKSDHTLTLEASGDPTTFNMELEVARPKSGIMMELTSYEVAEKMLKDENGRYYAVDGSTILLSE